ncbi:MAG: hypothetical protein ACR2M3_08770 [Thermomicrobiales bacterium]
MRLNTRIATLERQTSGTPALVTQWVNMLTRLYASIAATDARESGSEAGSSARPVNPDAIRAEAERYAATGSPATFGDLFRLVREAEGGE